MQKRTCSLKIEHSKANWGVVSRKIHETQTITIEKEMAEICKIRMKLNGLSRTHLKMAEAFLCNCITER